MRACGAGCAAEEGAWVGEGGGDGGSWGSGRVRRRLPLVEEWRSVGDAYALTGRDQVGVVFVSLHSAR